MGLDRRALTALLLVALGLGPALARAAEPASPAAPDAAAQEDGGAATVVERMAQRIAGATSLRVRGEIAWDVVQPDGRTLEFGATREITLRRPDRLRVDMRVREGGERRLLYDGKQVVLHDVEHAVYATAPREGPAHQVVAWVGERLGVPVALAEFVSPDLAELLRDDMQAADYVAAETVDGTRCDHVSLRNEIGGIQLWIGQEDALPRRITISYEHEEGRPQFRARFEGWELSSEVPDAVFAFAPPEGAEKIAFARRAPVPPAPEGETP